MATQSTQQRVEQQLDQVHQMRQPDEARTKITAFPAQVVYEGRYALQVLKEQAQQNPNILDTIEPLAIAVGWVEASAFFAHTVEDRDILQQLKQQKTNNN